MTSSQKDPSAIVVPIGKHKGATVAELLAKDPQYAEWLLAQGWVAERFAELHAAILTRGATSDDTPDHNAIQAQFLDETFRVAALLATRRPGILKAVSGDADDEAWSQIEKVRHLQSQIDSASARIEARDAYLADAMKPHIWDPDGFEEDAKMNRVNRHNEQHQAAIASLAVLSEELLPINAEIAELRAKTRFLQSAVVFEHQGIDVIVPWSIGRTPDAKTPHLAAEAYRSERRRCATFELKPSMGDDYPTVMRQMARLGVGTLVVEEYSGRAVPEPVLRQMFEANGRTLLFVRDIESELSAAREIITNGIMP